MNIKSFLEKATHLYLFLMIILFLLSFGKNGYYDIFDYKKMLFLILNFSYIILCTLLCICYCVKNRKNPYELVKIKFNIPCFFVCLYGAISLLSAFLSNHFPKTILGVSRFEGALTQLIYCTVFLLVYLFAGDAKKLFFPFCFSVTFFDIICVLQLLGKNPFGLFPEGMNYYDKGVKFTSSFIGTVGNANLSGAFLSLAVPILFMCLFSTELKHRTAALPPLLLSLIVVANMSVSACILALFLTFPLCLSVILSFYGKKLKFYFLSLLLIGIIFIVIVYYVSFDYNFLKEMHHILHGEIDSSFGSGRIHIWKQVLSSMSFKDFVLGKGPDTMLLDGFEPFARFYPEAGRWVTRSVDAAHNEYLNILYHQGIFALISYVSALLIVLMNGFKTKSREKKTLALGVFSYAMSAFFGISMCPTAPFLWITLALVNSKNET